jgi:beta-carotene 3-hydroxylase
MVHWAIPVITPVFVLWNPPALLVAAGSFLAMEPVAALVHRRVMHGGGWGWHRSHHARPRPGAEANDAYPLVMAGLTVGAMLAGTLVDGLRPLLWIGAGLTGYGAAYLVVHDLLVHQRLGRLPLAGSRYVRWVAGAHARHHDDGGAPYGFLVPLVPSERRGPVPRGVGLLRPVSARAATRTFSVVGTRTRSAKTS